VKAEDVERIPEASLRILDGLDAVQGVMGVAMAKPIFPGPWFSVGFTAHGRAFAHD